MNPSKRILFLIILSFSSFSTLYAQAKTVVNQAPAAKVDSTKPVSGGRAAQIAALRGMGFVYNNEWSIEGGIHTGGWSVGYNTGIINTYYKTTFWHFGFEEVKSPRESSVSTSDQGGNGSRSSRLYIYGKQATLFNLQAGYGVKRSFSEKSDKNGLGVGMSYCFGANLGLVKPYYLDILEINQGQATQQMPKPTRYTPETESLFLQQNRIEGASLFTYGFNQITPIPGIFGRIGVHLDWGEGEEFVRAAEVGVKLNAYPVKIPIMVTAMDNQSTFVNFYLILQFGQRR